MNRVDIRVLSSLVLLGISTPTAYAIDHSNLDKGRPLQLEDPYPIATGEIAVEAGLGFTIERRSEDRSFFPIQVLYGAYPNLQLGIGTTLSTDPRAIDEQERSGDLNLEALYNFNQETLNLPALGVKLELNLPTGVDSSGTDVSLTGLVTKSFGHLSLHANAGYAFLSGEDPGERDGRYEIILGASYPIGAPHYTRLTVLGDLFTEQSVARGESNVAGAEVGLRYQLTYRAVLDAGLGSEFAGPTDRSSFYLTTGLSVGF
jgi:outer membrane putative beta-barrel porin/alpha-amylase